MNKNLFYDASKRDKHEDVEKFLDQLRDSFEQ